MDLPEQAAAQADVAPAPTVLFMNDTGELPLDTRRVLVQLLSGPSLEGRRHPKLWPVLLRDETVVQRRLHDLFLDLVIDRDLQVAFTRQVDAGDLDIPILLRRAQLTFIDSVLVLFLRQRLTQAEAHGDRAVVARDEMVENLVLYERAASTDRAGFTKRISASIEKMKKHNILQKIRASEDRFEISPTLKLLFTAEEIVALTALYDAMAAGESPELERQPLDDGEDEE
ncbi:MULTISPECIES: DUF4194 domain-containing protein [unclassified Duganella]|uniref:DUF4194 domain-containing protein n=1 Tax=unclassified Duganella TaxID=2636909 RepID=UPI0006FFF2AF|nr:MULTISPECIES: DUF4194 domain-containing protein [unclassified Duganella]KQV42887.1 hypothetical protein ASD07_20775 [Duganella sp. Root336D2]KRB97012.1 hypothetical protein ASE26_02960 [Duganella sp. Root198D2]